MSNENATGNAETIPIKKLSKEDLDFQKLLTFANLARLTRRDLNSNEQAMATFHKNFNKDDVMKTYELINQYGGKVIGIISIWNTCNFEIPGIFNVTLINEKEK